MLHHYRITKYDPSRRLPSGAYPLDEWTAFSDVGKTFQGQTFELDEYLRVEAACLGTIRAFLNEAGIAKLQLRGLENHWRNPVPAFVADRAWLDVPQSLEFSRLALREVVWGKLGAPGKAYVHFGWDFYLYVGVPRRCRESVSKAGAEGLFVQAYRSPYLRRIS